MTAYVIKSVQAIDEPAHPFADFVATYNGTCTKVPSFANCDEFDVTFTSHADALVFITDFTFGEPELYPITVV